MSTRAHVRTIRIRQDLLPAGAAISIRGGKLRQNATLGNSLKGTALRCRVRDIVVTAIASERSKREVHRHKTVTRCVFLSFATWSSFVDRSIDGSVARDATDRFYQTKRTRFHRTIHEYRDAFLRLERVSLFFYRLLPLYSRCPPRC